MPNNLPIIKYGEKVFWTLTGNQKRELYYDVFEEKNGRLPNFFEKVKLFFGNKEYKEDIINKISLGQIKIKNLEKNEKRVNKLYYSYDIDIEELADSQVVKEPVANVKVEEISEEEKKIVNVFEEKKLKFVPETQQELHINKLNKAVVDVINDSDRRNELGLDFFRKKPILYLESTKDIDEGALEFISSNVLVYIKDGVSKELSNNRFTQQIALIYEKSELLDLIKKMRSIESAIMPSWSKVQVAAYLYEYIISHIGLTNNLDYVLEQKDRVTSDRMIRSLRVLDTGRTDSIGVAILYKELCERNGIECEYCYGGGIGEDLHSWNIITIDGKQYPVDCYNGICVYNGIEILGDPLFVDRFSKYSFMRTRFKDLNAKQVYFADNNVPSPYCSTIDYTKLQGIDAPTCISIFDSLDKDAYLGLDEESYECELPERIIKVSHFEDVYKVKLGYPFRFQLGDKLVYQFKDENDEIRYADATDLTYASYEIVNKDTIIQEGDTVSLFEEAERILAAVPRLDLINNYSLLDNLKQQEFTIGNDKKATLKFAGLSQINVDRNYQFDFYIKDTIRPCETDTMIVFDIISSGILHTNIDLFSVPYKNITNNEFSRYVLSKPDVRKTEVYVEDFRDFLKSLNLAKTKYSNDKLATQEG